MKKERRTQRTIIEQTRYRLDAKISEQKVDE